MSSLPDTSRQPPIQPPAGDEKSAEKYLSTLIRLIHQDKLQVSHTDLAKFNVATMQDHYGIDLAEYEIEISHNVHPETKKDFYTMLFNSIRKVTEGCSNKVILAYVNLSSAQFYNFKTAVHIQQERKRKAEEAKQFQEVLKPVEKVLDNLESNLSSPSTTNGHYYRQTSLDSAPT